VAIDVARLLSKRPAELAVTDMADYAIEALSNSSVREIHVLGRRGPAQAAFSTPEIKEMGELQDADIFVAKEDVELDPISLEQVEQFKDRTTMKNIEVLKTFDKFESSGKKKSVKVRFWMSPVEIIGDDEGRVSAIKLVRNKPVAGEGGSVRAEATDQFETMDVGLVFRSVGYRGVSLPDVPFNDSWGTIHNDKGRIVSEEDSRALTGMYTAGWIKRGPTGVIGTNKTDAQETVHCMVEDLAAGSTFLPSDASPDAAMKLIRERQPNFISYEDWLTLDAEEVARGEQSGRPRVKFTSVDDMLEHLDKHLA